MTRTRTDRLPRFTRWLTVHSLGSMKLAVALLAVFAVVLIGATWYESVFGMEAARRAFYRTLWFDALLLLLGLNVLCATLARLPWQRKHLGFVVTHAGIVVLLAGAMVGKRFLSEGQMELTAGGEPIHVAFESGPLPLGFAVQLEEFLVERNEGTLTPSAFRSQLRIVDPATGASFTGVATMNHPVTYRGYKISQAAFRDGAGQRGAHVLVYHVVRDPGWPAKWAGSGLIVAGIFIMFYLPRVSPDALAPAEAGAP